MKKSNYLMFFLLLGTLAAGAQKQPAAKINISKLIVYEKDNRLFIDWATDGTVQTNYWEVQGSVDGKKFSTIALVLGADPGKAGEQYEYKGKINTQRPAIFYRIVHIDPAGIKQESNIIKLMKLESASLINPDIKNKVPVLL